MRTSLGFLVPAADAASNALFWPSFIGSALIVMSHPVSFGAFLGDWSRYIPAETPKVRVMAATFLAQLATLIPFGFGLVTATTCTAPWMIIMMIGYVVRRGWYDADSLQVFNRRQTGGRYWFNHGWNWRAMAVWTFAAVMGILFVNIPGQFTGPLGDLAAGVDLSIPVSIGLAAVLYPLALWFFPEPADAFGPAGPRFVRAAVAKDVPITAEEPAAPVPAEIG